MNNGAQAIVQHQMPGPSKASAPPKTPRTPKASNPPINVSLPLNNERKLPLQVEVKAKCTICTLPFLVNNISVGMCGHAFHRPCVNRWLMDVRGALTVAPRL